jgi:hypothetical protein
MKSQAGTQRKRKPTRSVSNTKKAAAAALIHSGIPIRTAAKEVGIGTATAFRASKLDLQPEEFEMVKERIQSRLLVASDRFLGHSVKRIKDLGPYQAMLCAGIAHDHYLRSRAASQGAGIGSLTQILVLIDQRTRSSSQSGDGNAT